MFQVRRSNKLGIRNQSLPDDANDISENITVMILMMHKQIQPWLTL